jgi:hypothetical protein
MGYMEYQNMACYDGGDKMAERIDAKKKTNDDAPPSEKEGRGGGGTNIDRLKDKHAGNQREFAQKFPRWTKTKERLPDGGNLDSKDVCSSKCTLCRTDSECLSSHEGPLYYSDRDILLQAVEKYAGTKFRVKNSNLCEICFDKSYRKGLRLTD